MRAFYYFGILTLAVAQFASASTEKAPVTSGRTSTGGTGSGLTSKDVSDALRGRELNQAAGQARFEAERRAQDQRRAAFEKKVAEQRARDQEEFNEAAAELDKTGKDLARKQTVLGDSLNRYLNVTIPNFPPVKAGLVRDAKPTPSGTAEKAAESTGGPSFVARALSSSITTLATMVVPVDSKVPPEPEAPTDTEGGKFPAATRLAFRERFEEFVRNTKSIAPPDDVIARFAANEDDWTQKEAHDFKSVCGDRKTAGACFRDFFVKASEHSAKQRLVLLSKATGGNAAAKPGVPGGNSGEVNLPVGPPATQAPKTVPPKTSLIRFPAVNYVLNSMLEMVEATIAALPDESANFIRAKLEISGLDFVAAFTRDEKPIDILPSLLDQQYRRAVDRAGSGVSHGNNDDLILPGNDAPVQGVYRRSANKVMVEAVPQAAQLAERGLADFNKADKAEQEAEKRFDAASRRVQAAKEKLKQPLPEFPEAPLDGNDLANAGGTSGTSDSGGGSGGGPGGGSGGGGGGGGGTPGKGVQPSEMGDTLKFAKAEFGPSPEGVNPMGGIGPNPNARGATDRGALPPYGYNIPNFNFPGNASNVPASRTKPFGLGSQRGNPAGEPNLGKGSAANTINEGGPKGPDAPGGAGGSGGTPPVGKGGDGGGGGLGSVPSAGEGQGGGEDRGVTNNFVRLTDYGNGGGEGGQSGSGPDGDNSDNMITQKSPPIQNGKIIGSPAEIREVKVAARVRGLGIMANVGAFSEFCSEPKNVAVTLCAASGRRGGPGQAFRAPNETIGEMMAAKLAGGERAARGLSSVTQ